MKKKIISEKITTQEPALCYLKHNDSFYTDCFKAIQDLAKMSQVPSWITLDAVRISRINIENPAEILDYYNENYFLFKENQFSDHLSRCYTQPPISKQIDLYLDKVKIDNNLFPIYHDLKPLGYLSDQKITNEIANSAKSSDFSNSRAVEWIIKNEEFVVINDNYYPVQEEIIEGYKFFAYGPPSIFGINLHTERLHFKSFFEKHKELYPTFEEAKNKITCQSVSLNLKLLGDPNITIESPCNRNDYNSKILEDSIYPINETQYYIYIDEYI